MRKEMELLVFVTALVIVGMLFVGKKKLITKHTVALICFICVCSIIPLFILGKYNYPSADDYDYSFMTRAVVMQESYNVWDLLKAAVKTDLHFYNNWQGLYSSAFILSLQPGIWGEQYYSITTIIVFLTMFITTYLSIKNIRSIFFLEHKKYDLFFTLLSVTIMCQGMPDAREALYWYNGALNYIPFVFLTFLNLTICCKYMTTIERKKKIVYCVESCILSMVISGGNHVTSFLNIMLLVLVCCIGAIKKKYIAVYSLSVAVIGFVIMYIAPGTGVRQDLLSQQSVIKTMFYGAVFGGIQLIKWMNIHWICTLLLFSALMRYLKVNCKNYVLKYHPIIVLIISYIILVGMFCVPYFAMGSFGGGRIKNVIWITFYVLSVANMIYICMYYTKLGEKVIAIYEKKYWKYVLVLCMLCISVCGNCRSLKISNAVEAMYEMCISMEAQDYASEMQERFSEIEKVVSEGNKETVILEKIENYPKLLYGGSDIATDANVWPNTSMGRYYGINVVRKE